MHVTDNEFFEEYKRLDRLCGDMYACQNGVSAYLAAMDDKALQGQSLVSCWRSDYRQLKHVRWVRNRIAHDSGQAPLSEPDDLAFVQEFYHRILVGQDALTLLRVAQERAGSRTRQKTWSTAEQAQRGFPPPPDTARTPPRAPAPSPAPENRIAPFLAIAVLLLAIAVLYYYGM